MIPWPPIDTIQLVKWLQTLPEPHHKKKTPIKAPPLFLIGILNGVNDRLKYNLSTIFRTNKANALVASLYILLKTLKHMDN